MTKDKFGYRQSVAFINRENELKYLKTFIDKEPSEILFLHGPKSSGKTTLLYKFFNHIQKQQNLDVKFLNLREKLIGSYKDFIKIFFGIDYSRSLTKKRIKPVIIIDELQAIDHIYMNNGKDRQLIIELFNFFVAMSKESHLAHIIIASSDGYFLNTVYEDSKLKKCSQFYNVDYLAKKDVMEWLSNLEKYSKITAYTLTEEDAHKIWDVVGGSMWEIQLILSDLFNSPLDQVLDKYEQKMLGMITYSMVKKGRKKREQLLKHFVENDKLSVRDTEEDDEELLRTLVSNNILYFDPTRAEYYPQGKSFHLGIRLYFQDQTRS